MKLHIDGQITHELEFGDVMEHYVEYYNPSEAKVTKGLTMVVTQERSSMKIHIVAKKYDIPLKGIGRNIGCYSTIEEAFMGYRLQLELIDSKWMLLN